MSDEPTEDQLWAMLPEQVGVAKVSTLIDLTNATVSRNEYGYALSIADTGVEVAVQEQDEQVLAKALVTRAHVYWHLNRYTECGEDHKNAAELFERFESLMPACRSFYDAAKAFYYADDNDAAMRFNQLALALARASEDPEAIGRCLLQTARLQDEMCVPGSDVLETLAEARNILRSEQLSQFVMECDDHRLTILVQNDRLNEAIELLRGLLRLAETLSEGKSAYFNYMMGRLLRQIDQTENGLPYLEKSAAINVSMGDMSGLASVLNEQARCLRRLGRFDEAIELSEKAKAHFDSCGNDDGMFISDMVRISTLRAAGRFDEVFAECEKFQTKTDEPLELFIIGLQLAETCLTQGNHAEALAQSSALSIDDAWEGIEPSWFTYQRIAAEALLALGEQEQARLISQVALGMRGIKFASNENRKRLRQLAAE